jgi:hypothetical protein
MKPKDFHRRRTLIMQDLARFIETGDEDGLKIYLSSLEIGDAQYREIYRIWRQCLGMKRRSEDGPG